MAVKLPENNRHWTTNWEFRVSDKPPTTNVYAGHGDFSGTTYYSLHVHEVNGQRPTPEDYQRVADLIGARFDHALRLSPQHEQEGPDLCL